MEALFLSPSASVSSFKLAGGFLIRDRSFLSRNYKKNLVNCKGIGNNAIKTNVSTKDMVSLDGPFESKSQTEIDEGIGIVEFLKGKSFFITGGTGFLAKVLIEKILRTMPDVGKKYLLIKAKNKEAAMTRLDDEIVNSELFKPLQQSYGKSYEAFMLSKLVGNVCESDLGLDIDLVETIAKEVDVIVNSAANTTFDERYDVSLGINTKGPYHLMNLAKKCNKLKLFLQVSTAYVNGQRKGTVLEKAFRMGECIAYEGEQESVPILDIENEMMLALNSDEALDNNSATRKMKELGLQRAKKYGCQNTYVFTKAMGEMMLDSTRGNIPVVIIRPSAIESTAKEPFPGWIEGNRLMDPIMIYYGKGMLTGFVWDPNVVIDVVPADMVVNATLAAMAHHGQSEEPDINVYQIGSSVVNPLVFKEFASLLYEYYKSSPCLDLNGRPIHVAPMKIFRSTEDFSEHLSSDTTKKNALMAMASMSAYSSQKLEVIYRKFVEQVNHMANIYEPYTFYGGRFDNSNTQRLMESMSEEEKRKFEFDVESINWADYIIKVHIPGLRKHVMKGRGRIPS